MSENVNKQEISAYLQGIQTCTPLLLVLDDHLKIHDYGKVWKKLIPSISFDFFSSYFTFDNKSEIIDLRELLKKISNNNQLLFFNSLDNSRRFKCGVIVKHELFILLVQPVINQRYSLMNYGLEIKDFLAHEYIAEYLFLKQSVDKSLSDLRKLVEKVKTKNKELEKVKNELISTNTNLETRIIEETEKNIEFHKSFVLNEKLATIGELSAGIAHDLNTPLASINVGIEGIKYIFENIQKINSRLKPHEVSEIYQFSLSRELDLYPKRIKKEESEKLSQIIIKALKKEDYEISKLTYLFNQTQIKSNENDVILTFLNYSSIYDSLKLLHSYLEIKNLLRSSIVSIEKATEIVSNLKNFIRNDSTQSKVEINLKESIETVLNVFRHEVKKNVALTVEIDSNLVIKGHKQELFQLWSNLIKNAIEAFHSHKDKILVIKSFESSETIIIEISNSGDTIKKENENRIFEKFQSTKLNKSGTGLGLSIAKRIMESHNGNISYDNSRKLTTFIVNFKKTHGR